jgi:hypothetical protein
VPEKPYKLGFCLFRQAILGVFLSILSANWCLMVDNPLPVRDFGRLLTADFSKHEEVNKHDRQVKNYKNTHGKSVLIPLVLEPLDHPYY